MKGLIRKDFCQWKNYAKQYALMLVVFFGIGIALKSPEYTAFMTLIIGLSLTMSGFSTDEYYHWDVYACALPVDRKEIVAAKYATILLLAVFLSAVSAIFASCFAVRFPPTTRSLSEKLFFCFWRMNPPFFNAA